MGLPFLPLAFLLCCTVSSVAPGKGSVGWGLLRRCIGAASSLWNFTGMCLGLGLFSLLCIGRTCGFQTENSFLQFWESFLKSVVFFFPSTVLSVFSLKCFLSTCWASWTVSLVSFFSYFPSHLLAVLSGRCTQPCLISFCWGFHSCSLISKISLVLWIFRITSCSYFMVVILSNGIFSPCNISFLQVVYFGFSLIIKAFLRYLAGEPWLSAHL